MRSLSLFRRKGEGNRRQPVSLQRKTAAKLFRRKGELRLAATCCGKINFRGKGMEVTFQQLREKQVVSTQTGACLGKVCDLTFNFKTGCVLGVVLPGKGFFSREDLFIPLSGIEKIGEDVILVRITPFEEEGKARPDKKRPFPPPRSPYEGAPQGNHPPISNRCVSPPQASCPPLATCPPQQACPPPFRVQSSSYPDRNFEEDV
jgi:sporulation protein YlmC with PRC-barrel domain